MCTDVNLTWLKWIRHGKLNNRPSRVLWLLRRSNNSRDWKSLKKFCSKKQNQYINEYLVVIFLKVWKAFRTLSDELPWVIIKMQKYKISRARNELLCSMSHKSRCLLPEYPNSTTSKWKTKFYFLFLLGKLWYSRKICVLYHEFY